MDYLTYEEYKEYGGELPSTTFNSYVVDAQVIIDSKTFNRLSKMDEIPEKVKQCVFKLIDLMEQKSECFRMGNDNSSIISQANDGVSLTYNKMSPRQKVGELNRLMLETVNLYLAGVSDSKGRPILYRGIYDDE